MSAFQFLVLWLLCLQTMEANACIQREREALLSFKAGIKDPSNSLATWQLQGKDCCRWWGVACSNKTGHVIELNLQSPVALGGEIRPSLLSLSRLTYLDLSGNDFGGRQIPEFFGSFRKLRYLNLADGGFGGTLPPQLGNLSSLRHLDLSGLPNVTAVGNLWWVSRLSSLEYLDMSFLNTTPSIATNWLPPLSMLSSLRELRLRGLGLSSSYASLTSVNFTALTVLDLSLNNINSTLPSWLWNLSSLTGLHLSYNQLNGMIPRSIGNLCNLESLELGSNLLHGHIPFEIGTLSNLTNLDFGNNSLEGVVSEAHFANLTRLEDLDLSSSNSLTFAVDYNWIPVFQLYSLYLDSCELGPRFPAWIRRQTNIISLSLSDSGIVDTIPSWFGNFSSSIEDIDLSNNQMHGKLPVTLKFMKNLHTLDLRSNQLQGRLPSLPNTLYRLFLSNNSFSGPLHPTILPASINVLLLSHNLLSGVIPSDICELVTLAYLDLSNNYLSGELPRCSQDSGLQIVNFANNNLSGNIPNSICSLEQLQYLQLNGNCFSGEFPTSLQQCKGLIILDLRQNSFFGEIPAWIGHSFPQLTVLQLGMNAFYGNIPPQLAELSQLQVLDLAGNKLSGSIPHGLGNFGAMVTRVQDNFYSSNLDDGYTLLIKGEEHMYSVYSSIACSIDFSSNNLTGEIPEEVGALLALNSLNLSGNHFTGRIPETIGGMRSLESLDLSMNELSGTIPQSLSELTFLAHLNLSYNNLSGRIPTGPQLQTLDDPSIYMGNADLCGPPTHKSCSNTTIDGESDGDGEFEEGSAVLWSHYASMGLGFVVGNLGVCGFLLFLRTYRNAFLHMIDHIYDRMFVKVAVTLARLKRKPTETDRAIKRIIGNNGEASMTVFNFQGEMPSPP